MAVGVWESRSKGLSIKVQASHFGSSELRQHLRAGTGDGGGGGGIQGRILSRVNCNPFKDSEIGVGQSENNPACAQGIRRLPSWGELFSAVSTSDSEDIRQEVHQLAPVSRGHLFKNLLWSSIHSLHFAELWGWSVQQSSQFILGASESNWDNLAMKARPLSDPRDVGRWNLRIISIINFLATTWTVSVQEGKASTQPVVAKQSWLDFISHNSPGTIPWLHWPRGNMFFAFTWTQVRHRSEMLWSFSQCPDSQTWGATSPAIFWCNCMTGCKALANFGTVPLACRFFRQARSTIHNSSPELSSQNVSAAG